LNRHSEYRADIEHTVRVRNDRCIPNHDHYRGNQSGSSDRPGANKRLTETRQLGLSVFLLRNELNVTGPRAMVPSAKTLLISHLTRQRNAVLMGP